MTSIERQFGVNSTQAGALMSANDIGFALTVLVISHFAKDAHIPRILAVAAFVFGIISILIGAMNFVRPHSLQVMETHLLRPPLVFPEIVSVQWANINVLIITTSGLS